MNNKKIIEKPRKTTAPKPRESSVQRQIVSAILITWPRALVWKNSSTGTFDPVRKIFRNQRGSYTNKGMPDVMVLLDGKFFGIEVKRDKNSKPTDLQKEKIDHINRMGGYAKVIYDWKDAIQFIKEGLKHE